MIKINRTALFLIVTFVISWSLAGIFYVLKGRYNQIEGVILATVYMFVPMASALIVEKCVHKEKIVKSLFISFKINKWFAVAWLIAPLISFATFGISLLFPDVSYSPDMTGMVKRFESLLSPQEMEQMKNSLESMPYNPILILVIQGFIAGATINAVAAFGEELGWRGFLVKSFKNLPFWKAAMIIGLIWGIWHAPLILMGHNYPQHPQTGVLMMTAFCMLISPLFLYITIKSKSVIAAAVMHGTLNATAGISLVMIDGGTDLSVGMTGLAGFISLFIVLSLFFIYDQWISKDNVMGNKTGKFLVDTEINSVNTKKSLIDSSSES